MATDPSSEPLRVGIVGVGGMGGRHARNLSTLPGAEVVAVADPDARRREEVAAQVGASLIWGDPDTLVAADEVDAVVIASPDETHAAFALACLEVEKPALVEKPLATDAEAARRVLDAEAKLGRRLLQLGFMREYDPQHADLVGLVQSGEIGRPVLVTATHANPATGRARPVAEVVNQSAIHDLHTLRMVTGSEPEEVLMRVVPATDPGTARLVAASLRLADGCLGQVVMNTESGYGYEVAVEVAGTDGMAELGTLTPPRVRRAGWEGHSVPQDWLSRFEVAYRLEAEAWARAAATGGAAGPSVWDGYIATLTADACLESAAGEAGIRVPVPARPELYAPITAPRTSAASPPGTPGSSAAE